MILPQRLFENGERTREQALGGRLPPTIVVEIRQVAQAVCQVRMLGS
jgi:hypothetical protein